jgi:formylmethanofuran dehydrogenase subunit E
MAGENVVFNTPPKEGKIDLRAARNGVLRIDMEKLRQFNMVPLAAKNI